MPVDVGISGGTDMETAHFGEAVGVRPHRLGRWTAIRSNGTKVEFVCPHLRGARPEKRSSRTHALSVLTDIFAQAMEGFLQDLPRVKSQTLATLQAALPSSLPISHAATIDENPAAFRAVLLRRNG